MRWPCLAWPACIYGTNWLTAATGEPAGKPGWSAASRSHPAFAVSSLDPPEKSETYDIFRHPEGGRKDVFHWGPQGEKPVAELEIYRPGGEFGPSEALSPEALEAEIAARMGPDGGRELEAAGVVDSKFGTVTLLRLTGTPGGAKACLGFIKRLDSSVLAIPPCKYPAGRARAADYRPGAPPSAAC